MTSPSINRRRLFALGGLAAAGVALDQTALAAPSVPPARSRSRHQNGPVTLRFAHMNSWNAEWAAELDTMVARWNEENPDVQVEVIKWTWETYFATMTAAIGAGEAPDIMNVGWGEVVQFGRLHFLDVATMLTPEAKAGFHETSFKSCTYGDAIYGLPVFEQMNQVLYYRSDVAEEAGVSFEGDSLSWDDLVSAAQAMTTDERSGLGVNGMGRGIVEPFAPFQYQNDSQMVVEDGATLQSTFSTEESTAAARFFIDLWTEHGIVNPNNLGKGYTELVTDIGLGSVAMFHGITQNYFAIGQLYPEIADLIKIAPPQIGRRAATIGGAFSMSIFKYTPAPEEAYRFIEWATSNENLAAYWLPLGNVLSTRPEVPSPGLPDDVAASFLQYQEVQEVFPFVTQWEEIRERVLTPRLAQAAGGQRSFDDIWPEIEEETQAALN
ncbi:MAG: extracellular solute-binding protein [Chloroflexia bacterium]|nr:extracellular solute-binding protein [Chloroflexia bacterium]